MILQQLFTILASTGPPSDCNRIASFFGLVPWYNYLPSADFGGTGFNKCDINNNFSLLSGSGAGDIGLILLAVVDDLLRIAGIVAVAFVIYGAIKYIASQGSPDATASAQSTIINALIGVALAIVAVAAVSFIGNQLGG